MNTIQNILEQFRTKALVFHDHPQDERHGKMLNATLVELSQLFSQLESQGHQDELKKLLDDPDKAVQAVAASFVLFFSPEIALPLLEKLQYEFYGVGTVAHRAALHYKKETGIFLDDEKVKEVIRVAFQDVRKGNGIGAREANALDDYATDNEQLKAREQDTEEHSWDLPKEWRGQLSTALSFTDKEGYRFLLPGSMISEIDNESLGGTTLYSIIGNHMGASWPPYMSKEELMAMREISPQKIMHYYDFNDQQVHAIGLFLLWEMQQNNSYLLANREKYQQIQERLYEDGMKEKKENPKSWKNYDFTVKDIMDRFDEDCRIIHDWLKLGGVEVPK